MPSFPGKNEASIVGKIYGCDNDIKIVLIWFLVAAVWSGSFETAPFDC